MRRAVLSDLLEKIQFLIRWLHLKMILKITLPSMFASINADDAHYLCEVSVSSIAHGRYLNCMCAAQTGGHIQVAFI